MNYAYNFLQISNVLLLFPKHFSRHLFHGRFLSFCRKHKSIYVPPHQEFLQHFCFIYHIKCKFLFFLTNLFSFSFFFLFTNWISSKAKKKLCAANILKKIGGILWSSSVKNFHLGGISKYFDFKPEVLVDFKWIYVTSSMTHDRFQ